MHDRKTISEALALVEDGLNDCQIARRTGVPRSTIRDWRVGRVPRSQRSRQRCDLCAGLKPKLPRPEYAYLLGVYLGDGWIAKHPRTYRLRIVLDESYPGLIKECARCMRAVCPNNVVWIGRHGNGCMEVSMYWGHWPCLFPQHGPGRKHERSITLAPWQAEIVNRQRRPFVKGLLHSDGCRIVANDRGVLSTRYHFSNRSEDIKRIYCECLDALGIRWTRPCDKQIAVYRKASVAILESFVGPKT